MIGLGVWLYTNRKPLLIGLAIILLLTYIRYNGYAAATAECQAEKNRELAAIQGEKDRLQDDANKKSSELEATISQLKTDNKKLNARVANEIKINSAAYNACVVTNDAIDLYNSSTVQQ